MKKRKFLLITAVIFAALVLLVLLSCRLFWLQPIRVAARSMHPTLQKGDLVLVNKLAYSFSKPKKGDVVFISTTELPSEKARRDKRWIKRVTAVPEDSVGIRPPYIYINGRPLEDSLSFELPNETEFPNAPLKADTDEIKLSNNQYFLLGDNITNSLDSRHFGPVNSSSILGKVVYILAPADRRGPVK